MKKVFVCMIIAISVCFVACGKTGLNENEVMVRLKYDSGDLSSLVCYELVYDGVEQLVFAKSGKQSNEEVLEVVMDILSKSGKNSEIEVKTSLNEISITIGSKGNYTKEGIVSLPLESL